MTYCGGCSLVCGSTGTDEFVCISGVIFGDVSSIPLSSASSVKSPPSDELSLVVEVVDFFNGRLILERRGRYLPINSNNNI